MTYIMSYHVWTAYRSPLTDLTNILWSCAFHRRYRYITTFRPPNLLIAIEMYGLSTSITKSVYINCPAFKRLNWNPMWIFLPRTWLRLCMTVYSPQCTSPSSLHHSHSDSWISGRIRHAPRALGRPLSGPGDALSASAWEYRCLSAGLSPARPHWSERSKWGW